MTKTKASRILETTGMFPGVGAGAKLASDVLKATGTTKRVKRAAIRNAFPLAIALIVALPIAAAALAQVSGILTIAVAAYVAIKIAREVGQTARANGGIKRDHTTITAEELAARKARAYATATTTKADGTTTITR